MPSRLRRTLFSLVVFFATCGLIGMMIDQKVGAQSSTDESTFRDNLRSFTNVYDVVAQNYADPLTGDKPEKVIYDGAIPGMLRTLDPHSSFYDPKAYAKMREDQHGKYYGVGMTIQPQGVGTAQKIVVVFPFEGTPSYRAGIRPGDIIAAVDGKTTDSLNSEEVANMLKGPKGTHVQITLVREGAAKPLVFDLIRDEIPHNSVDLKFQIRPDIGYIHLTNFQETTGREISDALEGFGQPKGLILDLRGNPGGLLSEAVAVCDKFLHRGQIIVSQRGRAYPEQVYRATHGESGEDYPVVVLVNHGTASAAEIVSGALQDHDRALIVGETTFGKGLVQTVYQISDNTGLALTTYHYYTPSGRLIQRNYSGVSLYDYYYNHGTPHGHERSRGQAHRFRPHSLWRRRHHSRRCDRHSQVEPLPGDSARALRVLQLQQALPGESHGGQGLPGQRPGDRRVQGLPQIAGHCLHRPGHCRRTRLDQREHPVGDLHFAVWPAGRVEGPRAVGPDDPEGADVSAAGADAGAERREGCGHEGERAEFDEPGMS